MLARALPCLAKLPLVALLFLACAKEPPSGGPGSYRGVATNTNNEVGIMEVEVTESEKASLTATGTLKFPSKTLSLTGIINKSKTTLELTSSDGYKVVGLSRPNYAYGSYTDSTGDDTGSFALLLQKDSTVESFCGSGGFDVTADAVITHVTLPLAVTATPGGQAFCVGSNFVLPGALGTDKALSCGSSSGGQIEGKVDSPTNPWTTEGTTGTWSVTPCASNGQFGDAGVPEDAGAGADTGSAD